MNTIIFKNFIIFLLLAIAVSFLLKGCLSLELSEQAQRTEASLQYATAPSFQNKKSN